LKRTGEIILTVIGLIFSVFGLISSISMASMMKSNFIVDNFTEGFNEGLAEEGLEGTIEAGEFLNIFAGFGWFLTFISIVGIVVGIIAIIFLKDNKKPKAAGIILIVGSIIILLATIGMGFFSFVLYLIAGIMALVRKAPQNDNDVEESVITD